LRFASYKKEKALSLFALLEAVRFPFSFRRRRRVPGTMMCAMMCFEERARALIFVSPKILFPCFCALFSTWLCEGEAAFAFFVLF